MTLSKGTPRYRVRSPGRNAPSPRAVAKRSARPVVRRRKASGPAALASPPPPAAAPRLVQTSYQYFPVAKRDQDWGLFVTTVGASHIEPGAAYPPGGHPNGYAFSASQGRVLDEYQLVYISGGRGWFESAATQRVEVLAGTVLLLFPGVWHSYAPDPATGWREHWVGFNGAMADRLVRRGFFSAERCLLRGGGESRLLGLFGSLMEAARSHQPALQQIMAGTTECLLAALYSAQQSAYAGDDPARQIIHQAVLRMRETGPKPLHMPDLAAELHVSYRWFRRAFTHHVGLGPHHYLLEIRLARARELLAQSAGSIKEIAAQAGFEDSQYFSKYFHKQVGMSPGAWRQQTRQGPLAKQRAARGRRRGAKAVANKSN